MDRWKGKTAVVTGSSAGIGAAIAEQLLYAGLRVIGLDKNLLYIKNLRSHAGAGSLTSTHCDVTNLENVEAVFNRIEKEFGCVHVFVNNAGTINPGHITDLDGGQLSDEQLLQVLDTNVKATIMCTRKAVASMKKHSFDGHLVFINSIAGHYIPFSATFNVYPSSKHAVTAFTGTLLNELAHLNSGIRVTSISPGLVDTAMATEIQDMPILKPEDVANTVLYALSVPPHVNISEITIQPVREKRL